MIGEVRSKTIWEVSGWVAPFPWVLRCGLRRFPWNGELEHDGWRGEIVEL